MREVYKSSMVILLLLLSWVTVVYSYASGSTSNLPADPRLIFWLVPWGPDNDTYLTLIPYLPKIEIGIVFAFHTYGLGNQSVSLQQALSYNNNGQWISEQLSKLNAIYNNSGIVFINFFLATSYWRGDLTSVTPAQLVLLNFTLHQIAQLTNGGQKLVVGVSEMNNLNLAGYYEVYSLIHQVLPNAKLFYYTDQGQSVSSVESVFNYLQSNGITLNYLGYEVYPYPSYDYTNGMVYIPTNDVQQITELRNFATQNGVSFFIGEVGFRDGDLEGYYNPASTSYVDFNPTVGYNATIRFYENVISQLASMGIDLIGIWDYDGSRGDPFGLWFNPDFSSLLEYVGITPIKTAFITVISTFPYYYVNGSVHYSNRTYIVTLPANLTFVKVDYLNGVTRLVLTGIYGVSNVNNSTVVIDREGHYVITANYVTQYLVFIYPWGTKAYIYINGTRAQVFTGWMGWFDEGAKIVVFPQVIEVHPGIIYNITKTYTYIVNGSMNIDVPYVEEYYVKLNLKSLPAIINGTNSTLVSGYYSEGTRIEIPEYYYLNGTARLSISASPQEFVVGSPVNVQASETLQWLVRIVLPNGTLEGWYENGSTLTLPKTIEVNGTTYSLSGSSEVTVTGPLVLHPNYVKSASTASGTATAATTTTSTGTSVATPSTTATSTSSSSPATSPGANPAVPYVLLTVLIAVAIVAVIILTRK